MRGVLANGEMITRLRKSLGLTQAQLAQRARCDVKTARRAEQGQSLDMFVLRKIAAVLEVRYCDVVRQGDTRKSREQRHVQKVHQWLDAFNTRDISGMVECFQSQSSVRVPGAPELPGAGTFHGCDELRRHYQEFFSLFEVKRIAADKCAWDAMGNQVFLRGRIALEHRGHGTACRLEVAQAFRMQEGQIAELTVYCDTLAIYRMLREPLQK
jgi:transcriptional regulator with XRE-family HTH domain